MAEAPTTTTTTQSQRPTLETAKNESVMTTAKSMPVRQLIAQAFGNSVKAQASPMTQEKINGGAASLLSLSSRGFFKPPAAMAPGNSAVNGAAQHSEQEMLIAKAIASMERDSSSSSLNHPGRPRALLLAKPQESPSNDHDSDNDDDDEDGVGAAVTNQTISEIDGEEVLMRDIPRSRFRGVSWDRRMHMWRSKANAVHSKS